MKHNRQFYLLMLEYLFLEMRNMEENELKYVPKIAYIFHNVPALLLYDFNEQSAEQAYNVITARADALGLRDWLNSCEQVVISRINLNSGESESKAPLE